MSELTAKLICAKRKEDGTVLLGFEPFVSVEDLRAWLDAQDPAWSSSITPGGDGSYAASLTLNGVTRSTVVQTQGSDPDAEVLLALCRLFGYQVELPDEKIWFRVPQAEWERLRDKGPWTWEEVQELRRTWQGNGNRAKPKLPNAKLDYLRQLIKAKGIEEHEAIVVAYENGVIEQFVPGLEMLTEEQAKRLTEIIRGLERSPMGRLI